jgi:hypothetical protein
MSGTTVSAERLSAGMEGIRAGPELKIHPIRMQKENHAATRPTRLFLDIIRHPTALRYTKGTAKPDNGY